MSLSTEQIRRVMMGDSSWVSRNTGTKDDPSWENVDIEDSQEGDVLWFSANATEEDLEEAKRLLARASLHTYSKQLAEKKDMKTTKSGAFSFLILPNQSYENICGVGCESTPSPFFAPFQGDK